ncbi:ParB N-terminal domain-containing protein [Streptomyces sp. MBT49]|uniref:ParB/RepB/Spo0J family partition protein n=1 Tax=Streptomyces sp. MBT49 TaxID=1488380 RepID=UPI00190C85ED|nr:ParB/RepB/Spo0J family partition protein [Streptomyces sp. MBT49]MBK3624790.1 ParB N-terminal domain-containing protein [Streptomyces sp. MBT49]
MSDDVIRIPDSLAYLAVPIGNLTAYHRNPRTGNLDSIKESLTVNGQYRALVVNRGNLTGRPNEILAGNHTWAAASELGWDEIAVTYVDVDDDAAARIVIVDNRTSDLAGYDEALLADILAELPDLEGTGYDQDALDSLLDTLDVPSVLPAETADAEGEKVADEHLTWGYVQWGTTRVQITKEEVERLNNVHQAFYDSRGTDAGFAHHLIDPHDQEQNVA